MNELDAIQQQMADLWIDVSPTPEAEMPMMDWAGLSPEDEAMFQAGWQYAVEDPMAWMPMEWAMPMEWWAEMPAYDIEQLKIDIQPMLQWLPKDQYADLIIWMSEQFSLLNQQ